VRRSVPPGSRSAPPTLTATGRNAVAAPQTRLRPGSLRCSGQSAPPTYTPTSRREALKGHRSRSLGLNRCGGDDELQLAVGVAECDFDCFRRLSPRAQEAVEI